MMRTDNCVVVPAGWCCQVTLLHATTGLMLPINRVCILSSHKSCGKSLQELNDDPDLDIMGYQIAQSARLSKSVVDDQRLEFASKEAEWRNTLQ